MGEDQVMTEAVECKECEIRKAETAARNESEDNDRSALLEIGQQLHLAFRMLWEFKQIDDVECGTIGLMIEKQADRLLEIASSMESRMMGVQHG